MKICFLIKPYDNYMHLRAKFFIDQGHEVYSIYFASKNKGAHSSFNWSGSVALGRSSTLFVKYLNRILYPHQVTQFTNKHDIDIFHVNGMLNSFYLPFSRAKKQVIENQGSDVIRTADRYPMLKPLYRFFYRFVDGVVQDSTIAQNKGIELGSPTINNEVIEIGVDFRHYNPDVKCGDRKSVV